MFKNKKDRFLFDKELWQIIKKEKIRQEENINLIASENYVSSFVMKAQGSLLTNKYAEGYPDRRYYDGCQNVDLIEKLAISRAKKLFHAEYVNVQPHSGSQANFAVYNALLNFGDTILSMDLHHGGHLTHGSSVNFSGNFYNVINYKTDKNGYIDYDQINKLAKTHKPKMIIGGFSAYSGVIDWKRMRQIADSINSYLLADIAHIAGLVAAGICANPIYYAHVVTTTTHKTLCGPRGGLILSRGNDKEFYKKIDSSVFPGIQGGPLMHVIAAKAIAFKEAMHPSFKLYQKQIVKNAKSMVKIFLSHNFNVISKKTQNHMFLINLENKNITGKRASLILNKANIVVNKNTIPGDKNNPFISSGIRLGTPAITKRGLKEKQAKEVAHWMCNILNNIDNNDLLVDIKNKVLKLCKNYPIYKHHSF